VRAGLPRLTVEASTYSHGFLRKSGWQVDWKGRRIYNGVPYHSYDIALFAR